jgi:hypothetical protein
LFLFQLSEEEVETTEEDQVDEEEGHFHRRSARAEQPAQF